MRIKLVVDEHEVELGSQGLDLLVGNLPDADESLADLYHTLAQSNIAAVREAVARKSVISEETIANLASDPSPDVIWALVSAQCGRLSESAVAQIIQRNWSGVNREIAQNLENFDQGDVTALAMLLAGSADPSVRAALASNHRAPKVVVRRLLMDDDPGVHRSAQYTLKPRY
jgi:hypothetical protein